MKQEIEIVRVPWMISPSMPLLRLSVGEDEIEDSVSFYAFFAERTGHVMKPRFDPSQPLPQRVEEPDYGMVRIALPKGVWARYQYGRDFEEDYGPLAGFDRNRSRESYRQEWLVSGVCPHPRAYVVRGSAWMRELGVSEPRYTHLVFDGHEGYVEVVARGWSWTEVGPGPSAR